MKIYQYNTGGVCKIIEENMAGSVKKKRLVRKVSSVPINLMAAIQRGDLRETNNYQKGILGTEEVIWCEGGDVSSQNPNNYYTQEQIDGYIEDLVEGRRKYTEEIKSEDLNPEIVKFAEESFQIAKNTKKQPFITSPMKEINDESSGISPVSKPWLSKVRPPRPMFSR